MRIRCPFCGERDVAEFTYRGAASRGSDGAETFASVYLRDNPTGPHDELWYHAFGCRGWLQVTRDTSTHEILRVALTREVTR